jgi:hypothetical protein
MSMLGGARHVVMVPRGGRGCGMLCPCEVGREPKACMFWPTRLHETHAMTLCHVCGMYSSGRAWVGTWDARSQGVGHGGPNPYGPWMEGTSVWNLGFLGR